MRKSRPITAIAAVVLGILLFLYYSPIYSKKHDIVEDDANTHDVKLSEDMANIRIRNLIEGEIGEFQLDKSRYTVTYPPDSSCYLRDKLQKFGLPNLHSFFADPIGKYVAFNGLKLLQERWHFQTFICEFPDGKITKNDPILADTLSFGWLPQYIVIITCPLPEKYQTRSSFKINLRVLPENISSIDYVDVGGVNSVVETKAYENLTICQSGAAKKHFLAMCTMVKEVDEFIPPWLMYHRNMGVEHVYIYDNADSGGQSSMNESLRAFINSGFVTIIPWAHTTSPNKTYLEIQIAHENDCLWRHRHDALWMIKTDVDEYIQPMDPSRPKIVDYLTDPKLYSLGGLRIQNWFFGRPPKLLNPEGNIIQRNVWRSKKPSLQNIGHDKNILRPMNVHYFKIHAIKLGGELKSLNPFKEMRLVHYRGDNPRSRHFKLPKFIVKDTSMVQLWYSVLQNEFSDNPYQGRI
ncbi:uncharacterized protein LOC117111254 [Anneissia japonica]|uniref:uncharacterized protein LOC117111254 n=1 Tax=Anneissia japonica TaxID=1529436 RepID=UPI0014259042|nr:uncharacterized protein LOC117111254 [Anneissia japonica]XP_033110058.1 uncharacterized protein LOC117111254 [Anneissia japonica]